MVEHGRFHWRVLEHEQAVEQRLALGQFAALLDRHQRQVLVFTQLHVALEQALQPLPHTLPLPRRRQLHTQGHAVDEQANRALHLRHAHRPPSHGNAEDHVALAAEARQHQCPGRLGEGIDGQLVGLGQLTQACALLDLQPGIAVADDHAVAGMVVAQRSVAGQRRGALESGQVGLPPLARFIEVLPLQPADVIAIARRHWQLRLAALTERLIDLEEVVHQQRAAPGIDQDVVIAHHEPVTLVGHAHQAQVERRLAEQFEARFAFLLVQRLQALLLGLVIQLAPVLIVDGGVARLMDDLQHRFAGAPAERGTQGFVTGDYRLPGLGKALRLERAVDAVAVLHVVDAGARLEQGMQEHALLHRRHRVDVVDLRSGYGQAVDLLLAQVSEGEVRRGEAAVAIGQAMGNQRQQFAAIVFGQRGDGGVLVALAAEGPAQLQGTAVNLAIDAEPVGQRRVEVVGQARRRIQRLEQRMRIELLVELAEVVEGDPRLRQRCHAFAAGGVSEVTQYAVTDALVRHLAQLFLDAFDRACLGLIVVAWLDGQGQWIGIGKPADAAGQVEVFEQAFAAVAFQLHQHFAVAAPAAQGARQGGQQQVVDLGVIGRRRLLQQLAGLFDLKVDAQGLCMSVEVAALRMITGQLTAHASQLRLPPAKLIAQRVAAGIGSQARCPVADGVGLGREIGAAVQRLQVLEQHPPGHAIDHQVVDNDQQTLLALSITDQQGAQQRPLLQVEAALHIGIQRLAVVQIGDRRRPQQLLAGRLLILAVPATVHLSEAQPQAVVLDQQRGQRLFQARRQQWLTDLQQHGLVPMLRFDHFTVEEPLLDRRQRAAADPRALLDHARRIAVPDHRGECLDGLVLEQVARGELQAQLAGPADYLDRQNRIAAQLEEVVLHANSGDVEHLPPDLRQLLLERIRRGLIMQLHQLQIRRWQGAAVELAVAHQRQLGEQHQVCGDHIVRQVPAGMSLQRFAQIGLGSRVGVGLSADQIADQLLAAGQVQRQHHCLVDVGVGLQAAFDFTQFNPEATDLHLLVGTANVFDQAISTQAHAVAGAVQAAAVAAERVGDKTLGSQTGAVVITLGQAGAADVQFADAALGQQRQIVIQHVRAASADHLADRHAASVGRQGRRRQTRERHDYGFGRPIGVEQLLRNKRLADPLQVLAGQRFTAGDYQTHWQLLGAAGQVLSQLAAVAWGKAKNVHLLLAHQLADFLGAPLSLPAQDHPRTAQQRRQQALTGSIEVDRIEVQLAVVAAHAERADHGLAMHGDFAVADHHALGLAGGAGGVDQVGLMLRQAEVGQRCIAVISQGCGIILKAPTADSGRQLAEPFEQIALAEQQADAAVFDHVLQALQWVFRVERHIGTAGLEDCQQANDHFQRALKCQANPHLRADATLAQHPRQAIGLLVEGGIAEVFTGKGQRQRIRAALGLHAEQTVQGVLQLASRLALQLLKQRLLLGRGQHRQLAQTLLRVGDQPSQQLLPVLGHTGDARFIVQVAAVGQAAAEAAVQVGNFQVQVELGRTGVVEQVVDLHPGQLAALLEGPALHVAHHLEQRVVGTAARRLQGFDQLLERQVLVRLAGHDGVTQLLEQVACTHLPVQLAAQYLGVEEGANKAFAFRANPVGHRRTDTQVALAAVAVQQGRQSGGHGHEQGQAALAIERMHPRRQCRVEVEAVQPALMALHRRPWAVAGQFQQRLFIAQPGLPVGQLALAFAAFQPLPLPHAVVQVLHW
ncbi:hypothetical protein PS623_04669 [Pseudomonas fluorescens]|nr:hypothetical protein PS623_04669 [Pseudomonas fluorescens]